MNLTPEQAIPDIGQGRIGDVQRALGPIQAAAAPTAPPAGHCPQGLFRPKKFPDCAGVGGPLAFLSLETPHCWSWGEDTFSAPSDHCFDSWAGQEEIGLREQRRQLQEL